MAYYDDEYMWPQERTTYDLAGYQDSVSFSGYGCYDIDTYDAYTVSAFQEHNNFVADYHHSIEYDHNSFSPSSPVMNYFAYNYVEPKLIEYEPVSCDTGYVSYHTQYSISYSEVDSKFNEPEFEEYDPTPYGGGYDIVSVYGKPLPPSDQTCYPRSNPKTSEPTSSKPVANPIPKPESPHEPRSKPEPEPEPVHVPAPIPTTEPVLVLMPNPLESREIRETEREECSYGDYRFDYPWPEYDHGYGIGEGYDYGYGKQVVQVPPCEYNPEVVDLCENIFGSWPCLARIRKQQMDVNNNPRLFSPQILNPWEECASYIFGRPVTSSYR